MNKFEQIAEEMSHAYVGGVYQHYYGHDSTGSFRTVSADPTKNLVYKCIMRDSDKIINFAEYYAWQAMPQKLRHLFARVWYISQNRRVLVMERMPYTNVKYERAVLGKKRIVKHFPSLDLKQWDSPVSRFVGDLHEKNFGITATNRLKVIDYGGIGNWRNVSEDIIINDTLEAFSMV